MSCRRATIFLTRSRHSRNWRWHKKLQVWLTKDEHMTPQILSPNHERGYYIVWDTNNWRKDRVWATEVLTCRTKLTILHRESSRCTMVT